ncbi:hypothetical protein EW093_15935 [Thiospirochaeta perfilievii]|uniref:Uncharacterized protein n=1 Tax=Thiospirochaeta perfilievii TaxID=252967 RepID=A0A5C1QIV8_9SPIO|nr:hypothetical protein [Thiospirochaeta perfilievii]QEN06112.1 hypothetical protein EW093_15935 [Thiospirochaeta perfilievii]
MEKLTNSLIRYEENIFYLKLTINNITKARFLNINMELFQKKLKDDLIFIYKTSNILFEHLLTNKKLITKDEQLHSMLGLKNLFIDEIKELSKRDFIKQEDFSEIIQTNKEDINKIERVLDEIYKEINKEDLTTNEELNILFMEDED